MQQDAVDALVKVLELEQIEVNIFRGTSPDADVQRVFGGQVAGQALVAAGRTVDPDRRVHSLHAYFLRPGDPAIPILYEVDRIRDGRSFTTRRVVAIQHGQPIFNLSASFHVDETGYDHAAPMPSDLPEPETLPDFATRWRPVLGASAEGLRWLERPRPIDMRYVGEPASARREPLPPFVNVWLRADGTLPADPVLHACVVTYASDMTLLDTALMPHGRSFTEPDVMMASLDHAMWFHRPFRADEWLLYAQDSPSASGARGIARGLFFSQVGHLVASVVQEGLIRPVAAETP